MNELAHYIQLIWKKKWWILGFCGITIIAAFILTLPIVKTPLYRVELEFYPIDYPEDVQMKIKAEPEKFTIQYFDSYDLKFKILKKYGSQVDSNTKFNIKNYDKRITFLGANKSIIISVKHESAQIACEIALEYITMLNDRFHEYLCQYYSDEHHKHEQLRLLTIQQIDSIKQEITKLSVENQIFASTKQNQEIIKGILKTNNGSQKIDENALKTMLKMSQEKSADLITLEKILEEYVIDLEEFTKISNGHKINSEIVRDFAVITSHPYSEIAKKSPIPIIVIAVSAFLSLFFSAIFFILKDMLQSLFKNLK